MSHTTVDVHGATSWARTSPLSVVCGREGDRAHIAEMEPLPPLYIPIPQMMPASPGKRSIISVASLSNGNANVAAGNHGVPDAGVRHQELPPQKRKRGTDAAGPPGKERVLPGPVSPISVGESADRAVQEGDVETEEDVPLAGAAPCAGPSGRPVRRAALASAAALSSAAMAAPEEDEGDGGDYGAPPAAAPSSIPASTATAAPGSRAPRPVRRVSHSQIERRRREKINDCLLKLRRMVPQCRERLEAKEAKAEQRAKRRGGPPPGLRDGCAEQEASPHVGAGLHKLEILLGTLEYIEELENKLAALSPRGPTSVSGPERAAVAPSRALTRGDRSSVGPEDAAAMLLLNLASPELRPVP